MERIGGGDYVVVRDGAWMELGSRLCVGLTLARYIRYLNRHNMNSVVGDGLYSLWQMMMMMMMMSVD